LGTAQIGALTSSEVQAFTTTQANALTARQLGGLTTTALGNFSTTQIGALSTTQLQGLTTTQLNAVSSDVLDAIDRRGFTHLKLGQFDNAIADYDDRLRLFSLLGTSRRPSAPFHLINGSGRRFRRTKPY